MSESPSVMRRSVTQSWVYQEQPTQISLQGHPFKQGQDKYASPCQKGQENNSSVNVTVDSHLLLLCALNELWNSGKLECSQILRVQQFPFQNAVFSHFFLTPTPFESYHLGFQPWPRELGRNSRLQGKSIKLIVNRAQCEEFAFSVDKPWARVSPTLRLASLSKWSGLPHSYSLPHLFQKNNNKGKAQGKPNSHQRLSKQMETSDISSLHCTGKGKKNLKATPDIRKLA